MANSSMPWCQYLGHPFPVEGASQRVLTTSASPRPIALPVEVYHASLRHYERNQLAQLLSDHFSPATAADLCARFHLGTSTYWPGACVFWLLDTGGQILGGQVLGFAESGHTARLPGRLPADKPRRCTSWVHTALLQAHRARSETVPVWLTDYAAHGQKSPCLFGLPQLAAEPLTKPIALVESPKTAIVATPYLPDFIWLATMSLSYLTAERLAPLRQRRLVLFPDAGALVQWQTKAAELRKQGFNITVSDLVEQMATPAEREAGLDLADVLLAGRPLAAAPNTKNTKPSE